MADLPRAGREFFHWPISGLPADAGALELFIAGGWHPVTIATDQASFSLLLQGPLAPTDEPTAVVVPIDQSDMRVRLTDSPEIVIRTAGYIRLTD